MKKMLWPNCAKKNSAVANCALMLLAAVSASTALAQTPIAAVTDPNAAVPPVVYQSVFADTSKGVETQTTDWKKANADVGQFRRGHVDILKWDEANPQSEPNKPPGAPARPAAEMHKH